ncbi:aldolase [Candidatus Dependentiae bacterium]|nr:aldolase [Candidatus Dependentiae bacterium]
MLIPADIPLHARPEFRKNYSALTKGTDRLFLFAADHKIEHLDQDFHGTGIDLAAHHPTHLFAIAQQKSIGGFATQLGLVARYGSYFDTVHYIIKLNSKTNLINSDFKDPFSKQLWSVDDVISFKKTSKLLVCGVGLTVYIGSLDEDRMLAQAAQTIYQAHQQGLVTVLWMYPRGKSVLSEHTGSLLAGAAGIANALGADFVKIQPPEAENYEHLKAQLELISQAAGTTKVLYAGGEKHSSEKLFHDIQLQLSSGSSGVAIGRNIYQNPLKEALELCQSISDLVYTV